VAIWDGVGRGYGVYGETSFRANVGDPVMANPEHVEILKQGVEVWNQWKAKNIKINPDLAWYHLY
jgi:hypothetical protein